MSLAVHLLVSELLRHLVLTTRYHGDSFEVTNVERSGCWQQTKEQGLGMNLGGPCTFDDDHSGCLAISSNLPR
jgi:hypothetical protein